VRDQILNPYITQSKLTVLYYISIFGFLDSWWEKKGIKHSLNLICSLFPAFMTV
jgi:hypothetical protein